MKINENISGMSQIQAHQIKPKVAGGKKKAETTREVRDEVSLSGTTKYGFTEGNLVKPLETGGGKDEIVPEIEQMVQGSKTSVQVQMYRLGHNKIVDVLADQARKGVKVQLLMDPTPGYNEKDAAEQAKIQKYLQGAGVQILKYPIDGPSGKIDHIKMLIVDGKSLLIGGMNWDQHSPLNKDFDVLIKGPAVGDAQDVFNHDWKLAGGKTIPGLKPLGPQAGGDAKVRMLTTEVDRKDINTALQDNIKNAKKSIKMEAFALADKETIQNLIEAKERGVDVKIILDPNLPIGFVNRKSAKQLEEAGINVKWRDVDIGTREKLHAKLAMFDDDKTIIGSANFTNKGLQVNHEADVEVISNSLGTAFNKMFDQHWESESVEKMPFLPDFNETIPSDPPKEQMAKEIFRYFTEAFHPGTKRNWTGKKKAAVIQAIEKFDGTVNPGPVQSILGKDADSIDEMKEMEAIGDLASFALDIKEFNLNPPAGDPKPLYEHRLEISSNAADEVYKSIPSHMENMANDIKDPKLRAFVEEALAKVPEGFKKAPSASSGKFHPADEVDPNKVDITDKDYGEYKGGGLVLHSRRVQVMAGKLCDHYGIKGKEKDEVLAAAALHDAMKGVTMDEMTKAMDEGTPVPWSDTTTPEHGHVAAEWIKRLDPTGGKMTENVARLAAGHMSIWNKPEPTVPQKLGALIISMADYTVSQNNFYLKV